MMQSILLVGAAIAAWLLVAPRVFLAWCLREVRALDVFCAPDDAIVTYPLA